MTGKQGQKGIVLKFNGGQGIIHIHPDTLKRFMDNVPTDAKGWITLEATINNDPKRRVSHNIKPVNSFKNRLTKIDGPENYK